MPRFYLILLGCWVIGIASSLTFAQSKPQATGNNWPAALDSAQAFIKNYCLKSPATAKFARKNECKVKKIGDGHYEIQSFVDAQNTYGGLMRTHFDVDVWYLSPNEPGSIKISGEGGEYPMEKFHWAILIMWK